MEYYTYNDAVLAYMNIGPDLCRVDDGVFFNQHMITYMQGEERHTETNITEKLNIQLVCPACPVH